MTKAQRNPLEAWFSRFPKPMLKKDFAKLCGISQSFLTALLSEYPPWPARHTMRKITEITHGEIDANVWMNLADPPERLSRLQPAKPAKAAPRRRPATRQASGRAQKVLHRNHPTHG